ncbi:hypothetical protein F5146DRAFT_1002237 [Armillaria mellea]|nr:hypothetical protein F5146DRAFT_1002237 [Armillaria mellea]
MCASVRPISNRNVLFSAHWYLNTAHWDAREEEKGPQQTSSTTDFSSDYPELASPVIMSFQSDHSSVIAQGCHNSNTGGGVVTSFRPVGYRVAKLLSVLPDDWATSLTLDASYRFCYERKPTKDFLLQCPLPPCAKAVYGYEFRKHLKVNHPGFSQDGKCHKVACPDCTTGEIKVGSYVDHVLRTHCGVSARRCAYCDIEVAPEDDLTRHYIDSCKGLTAYRHDLTWGHVKAPGTAGAKVAPAPQIHRLARSHIRPRVALEETQKTGPPSPSMDDADKISFWGDDNFCENGFALREALALACGNGREGAKISLVARRCYPNKERPGSQAYTNENADSLVEQRRQGHEAHNELGPEFGKE